jgi:hypothetical protein
VCPSTCFSQELCLDGDLYLNVVQCDRWELHAPSVLGLFNMQTFFDLVMQGGWLIF